MSNFELANTNTANSDLPQSLLEIPAKSLVINPVLTVSMYPHD